MRLPTLGKALLPLAAAAALAGCAQAPAPERPRETPKDAVLHGATLQTWKGGGRVVTATAETVTWFRADDRFTAEAVVATLPSRAGPVFVTAPRLDGNVAGDVLDASGGVTLVSERGRGSAPTAHLENRAQGTVVSSTDGVQLSGPGQSLTAKAFSFDSAEQRATFEGVETRVGGAP